MALESPKNCDEIHIIRSFSIYLNTEPSIEEGGGAEWVLYSSMYPPPPVFENDGSEIVLKGCVIVVTFVPL